jgi:hypothetical protein
MLIAEIVRHKDEIVAVVDGFGSDLGTQEPEDSASAGRVGTERRIKVEKTASVLKAVAKRHAAKAVPKERAAVLVPKSEPAGASFKADPS